MGEVLETGSDLLLVGFGPIVQRLRRAARELGTVGLSSTVINARWAKPLDADLLARHAAGKRLVVTAEESAAMGGFGTACWTPSTRPASAPVLKIAAEGFVDHGAVDDLRRQQRIDVPGIVGRIGEALGVDIPTDASSSPNLERFTEPRWPSRSRRSAPGRRRRPGSVDPGRARP